MPKNSASVAVPTSMARSRRTNPTISPAMFVILRVA
jgi:hypothetical protein